MTPIEKPYCLLPLSISVARTRIIKVQLINNQNCTFIFYQRIIFSIPFWVCFPLFWVWLTPSFSLSSLNFILNHSSIGIPSMHNRNFPFFCGFLFTVAVEYAVPNFSRCSRESHFLALLGYRQQVFYISPP